MPGALSLLSEPKLLDRIRGQLRAKQYSIRTEQAYVDWLQRFICHGTRYPASWARPEVENFSRPAVRCRDAESSQ